MLSYINVHDVRSFGLIPDLLERLPLITYLEPLDKTALKRILTEPKNAIIKQFEQIFLLDGIALNVTEEALDEFVDRTIALGLEARGLRSLVESVFTENLYYIDELPPDSTIKRKDISLFLDECKIVTISNSKELY